MKYSVNENEDRTLNKRARYGLVLPIVVVTLGWIQDKMIQVFKLGILLLRVCTYLVYQQLQA